jgi:hypothetical protein
MATRVAGSTHTVTDLVLGPMLRYVSDHEATVWVETDGPCEVDVLGRVARAVHIGGRHYGLVVIRGLEPDSRTEYEVRLDGVRRWPLEDSPYPPSAIHTLPERGPVHVVWGSCRVARPHHPPYMLDVEDHPEGVGVDALHVLGRRMRETPDARRPHLLLLIGDQVYADEVSPVTREQIRARRDIRRDPGEEVLDVDEYTMLYRESWGEPSVRWLLSTVASAMMFDDHDVHDDWNTSESWIADMRATGWWHERILAALSTYWIYQHLGNLSPAELETDELWQRLQDADDGAPLLRAFAEDADRDQGGGPWAFSRLLGTTRLVVLDGREGRVLHDGRREMMDDGEWAWLDRQLEGDPDHVLIAGTLPVLLAPTLHWLEAWNEAVCDGAWGRWATGPGEWLRRALDLEHWAAFQDSFHRLIAVVTEVAAGGRGRPPASIVMLGGDVHQSYLERVSFPGPGSGPAPVSQVWQAVCSPFRNQLGTRERRVLHVARRSRLLRGLVRAMARSAGVVEPTIRWDVVQDPTWRNQMGWLEIDGRQLELVIETTVASHERVLETSLRQRLA